ncbi:hypothetical protein BURC_03605 [Burkholderiaceae bacterium]|nr:hypothetical protein BURC_03605 [Burkholderiaceae bacterium]
MANASTAFPPLTLDPTLFKPAFDLSNTFTQSLLQAQRMQLDAFVAWQQALTAMGQELWDEWVCHCAGGVPIDA